MSDPVLTKQTRDGRTVEVRLVDPYSAMPELAVSLDGAERLRSRCLQRLRQPQAGSTHFIGGDGLAFGFTASEAAVIERALEEARRAGQQRARAEADAALREEHAALFQAARATGEPQLIRSWMAECHDPRADCSLDHCELLAMPDGSTRTNRAHTH